MQPIHLTVGLSRLVKYSTKHGMARHSASQPISNTHPRPNRDFGELGAADSEPRWPCLPNKPAKRDEWLEWQPFPGSLGPFD